MESLRDLDLFGGEVQGTLRYNKNGSTFPNGCSYIRTFMNTNWKEQYTMVEFLINLDLLRAHSQITTMKVFHPVHRPFVTCLKRRFLDI